MMLVFLILFRHFFLVLADGIGYPYGEIAWASLIVTCVAISYGTVFGFRKKSEDRTHLDLSQ